MESSAFAVIKSKYFLAPVAVLTISLASVVSYYLGLGDEIIFPKLQDFTYNYYTDAANGGNSQVLQYVVSDSVIQIRFQLQDQFYSPYIGLSISPVDLGTIDARRFNQISISIRSRNLERVGISFFTSPQLREGQDLDEMLYHSYLNVSNQKTVYDIPISQFQYPEWWEDVHLLGESKKVGPDLSSILRINIGSAFSPQISDEKTIEIYRIAFTRNNHQIFATTGIIYLVLVLFNFGILYLADRRNKLRSQVVVSYKSVGISDIPREEEKSIEYINSNYSQSDLTLEKVAEATATTPRRITKIINDSFNCNFKTYINRIRINESKRFLIESNLNMGEIAFKVGFNNQSHFNRVFKSEMQMSPSEYRIIQKP